MTVLSIHVRKFLKRKYKFSWDGVWTLVMLQYSHVVYTSLSILNCPAIPVYQGDDSGVSSLVMFIRLYGYTIIIIIMY